MGVIYGYIELVLGIINQLVTGGAPPCMGMGVNYIRELALENGGFLSHGHDFHGYSMIRFSYITNHHDG